MEEKVLVPISKRLYNVICLTWKDYDPNEITEAVIAGDIESMLINYLDRERELDNLNPEAAEALEKYLRALYAELRALNRATNDEEDS